MGNLFKKIISLFVVVNILFNIGLPIIPIALAASTFYVDDSNTTPYNTISEAVDAASSGDTIEVASGVYPESIVVNKTLTIKGAKNSIPFNNRFQTGDSDESIITGAGEGFSLNADNVVIDGFKITGANIYLSPGFSGYQIKNNKIVQNIVGLYLNTSGSNQTLIEGNIFDTNNIAGTNSGYAIFSETNIKNILINHNKFSSNNGSIAIKGSSNSDISLTNNEASGNGPMTFYNTASLTISGGAFHATSDPAINLSGGNSNISITNNSFADIKGSALKSQNDSNLNFSNNTIGENLSVLNTSGAFINATNLGGNSTFSGNSIIVSETLSNGVTHVDGFNISGFQTGAVSISGNSLNAGNVDSFDGSTDSSGIILQSDLPNVANINISSNTIKGFVNGVQAQNLPSGIIVNVNSNTLGGNSKYALTNSGANINASLNDWGVYTDAEIAALVSGIISTSSFVTTNQQIFSPLVQLYSEKPKVIVTSASFNSKITTIAGFSQGIIDLNNLLNQVLGNKIVTLSGGLSIHSIVTSSKEIILDLPAGLVITSLGTSWDGTINPAKEVSLSAISFTPTSGFEASIDYAIEAGLENISLNFNKGVRVLLPGQAGKLAGFVNGNESAAITNICSSDSQPVGNSLPENGTCKIDAGNDLIIWTKHFTKFFAYRLTKSVTSSIENSGSSSNAACTDQAPSSAPVLLSAKSTANNEVTLIWSKAKEPVTKYLVAYGTTKGKMLYGNPNIGDKNTTSYTVKGLSGKTSYYFKVLAVNNCAAGEFSNELSVSTEGPMLDNQAADGFKIDFEKEILGVDFDKEATNAAKKENEKIEQQKKAEVSRNQILITIAILTLLSGAIYYTFKKIRK